MPYLVIITAEGEIRHELSGTAVLGRSTECDIWVNDLSVSRRHCRIELVNGHWQVIDMDSKNGILVHGQRVSEHMLGDGESFRIGSAKVRFFEVGLVKDRPKLPSRCSDELAETITPVTTGPGGRPLPTPLARQQNETPATPAIPAHLVRPLPFTRPPARPMVKPGTTPSSSTDEEPALSRQRGLLNRWRKK